MRVTVFETREPEDTEKLLDMLQALLVTDDDACACHHEHHKPEHNGQSAPSVLEHILHFLRIIHQQGIDMAHSVQQILLNLAATKEALDKVVALFAANDAERAALREQVKTLVAAAAISEGEKAALAAQIDAAWEQSDALVNEARALVPLVPPVGGTALATSYTTADAFAAAVKAYSGPETILLDGVQVSAAGDPSIPEINYYSHADGTIDMSGPTTKT